MLISGTPVGPTFKAKASNAVWSPSIKKRANLHLELKCNEPMESVATQNGEEKSPVWQPFGAPYDGVPFRPVHLDVSTRTTTTRTAMKNSPPESDGEALPCESRSPNLFTKSGWGSHLPPSQSPTITLLQKAREGQLPKGAVYIEEKPESTPIPKNAMLVDQKVTVEGDMVHTDSYYALPTLSTESSSHDVKAPPKYDGIGPTEYGIPVGLRTGVKEEYASDWYKTMFKSLHKAKFPNNKGPTGEGVHLGGYMSEPELNRKDKFRSKHLSEYRKKPERVTTDVQPSQSPSTKSRSELHREPYRVEPRSIANYEPGRSSLADKEFQKFWSDFWDSMDDLQQEHLGSDFVQRSNQSKRWSNVLVSDGYDSDSMLIRKTGRPLEEMQPEQQRACYKEIQKGGDIPLSGLRKHTPTRPTASPHQYQETEVNIHFKSPIRNLEKDQVEEEELKKRQDGAMIKLYEAEKRKKLQQEMSELEMRKHSDFFTPSQKSPIPLNRYDNPYESSRGRSRILALGETTSRTVARALFPFTAQTTRELSLSKGDIAYVIRMVDGNWLEGEHNGLVGLFPASYVEILPSERTEGAARVRFNFQAHTPNELSLLKGEKVVLTRRLDANWFEGRLGAKKGIFPVSYVEVLQYPGDIILAHRSISPRPPASPIYSPTVSALRPKHQEKSAFITSHRPEQEKTCFADRLENKHTITESLHIDTYNEPIPYRALYAYHPQNEDELELRPGDTAYVMELCDDGWYVGTSLRTGLFGTFPGNYVELI